MHQEVSMTNMFCYLAFAEVFFRNKFPFQYQYQSTFLLKYRGQFHMFSPITTHQHENCLQKMVHVKRDKLLGTLVMYAIITTLLNIH